MADGAATTTPDVSLAKASLDTKAASALVVRSNSKESTGRCSTGLAKTARYTAFVISMRGRGATAVMSLRSEFAMRICRSGATTVVLPAPMTSWCTSARDSDASARTKVLMRACCDSLSTMADANSNTTKRGSKTPFADTVGRGAETASAHASTPTSHSLAAASSAPAARARRSKFRAFARALRRATRRPWSTSAAAVAWSTAFAFAPPFSAVNRAAPSLQSSVATQRSNVSVCCVSATRLSSARSAEESTLASASTPSKAARNAKSSTFVAPASVFTKASTLCERCAQSPSRKAFDANSGTDASSFARRRAASTSPLSLSSVLAAHAAPPTWRSTPSKSNGYASDMAGGLTKCTPTASTTWRPQPKPHPKSAAAWPSKAYSERSQAFVHLGAAKRFESSAGGFKRSKWSRAAPVRSFSKAPSGNGSRSVSSLAGTAARSTFAIRRSRCSLARATTSAFTSLFTVPSFCTKACPAAARCFTPPLTFPSSPSAPIKPCDSFASLESSFDASSAIVAS
mmetsp:Transcript_11811/g.41743  ORF Transcript_11811/g.41743 Transcript_11811/m.41743 type:complete len:516 (+) Transcript_11811:484-2031(+)